MVVDHSLLLPVGIHPSFVVLQKLASTKLTRSRQTYILLGCVFWNIDVNNRESGLYGRFNICLGNISLIQSQWSQRILQQRSKLTMMMLCASKVPLIAFCSPMVSGGSWNITINGRSSMKSSLWRYKIMRQHPDSFRLTWPGLGS